MAMPLESIARWLKCIAERGRDRYDAFRERDYTPLTMRRDRPDVRYLSACRLKLKRSPFNHMAWRTNT